MFCRRRPVVDVDSPAQCQHENKAVGDERKADVLHAEHRPRQRIHRHNAAQPESVERFAESVGDAVADAESCDAAKNAVMKIRDSVSIGNDSTPNQASGKIQTDRSMRKGDTAKKNHQNSDRDARPRKSQNLTRQVRMASTGPRGGAANFSAAARLPLLSTVVFNLLARRDAGLRCKIYCAEYNG